MPDGINFNGTTYNSVDDMPPDVRQMYEQMMAAFNNSGQGNMADLLAGLVGPEVAQHLAQQLSAVIVNGTTNMNLENLPPEARAKFEAYQAQYDANRNGIPDAVEGLLAQMGATPTLPAGWSTGTVENLASVVAADDAANAPAFAASAPLIPPARPSLFDGSGGTSAISPEGGGIRSWLVLLAVVALGVMACVLAVVVVWALLR